MKFDKIDIPPPLNIALGVIAVLFTIHVIANFAAVEEPSADSPLILELTKELTL